MKIVSTQEAKEHFSKILLESKYETIVISEKDHIKGIMVSPESYQRFKKLEEEEDEYWIKVAEEAEKNEEFLGKEESEAFLKELSEKVSHVRS